MAQQKSEDRIVPEGRRKPVPTHGAEPCGGGKAVPVEKADPQLLLPFPTAENSGAPEAEGGACPDRSGQGSQEAPEGMSKTMAASSARMEEVVARLDEAFRHVAANRGAPGPDRETIEEVREHLEDVLAKLGPALLNGSYAPGDIRRVWIPKSGGGQRGLGIPNVVDRMVQEAVRMVLEPLYEPTFHSSSHGFRPDRSCHTAIAEAKANVEEGYEWVVDLDLEKFFDRVHHQRLMARLARRVHDKRLLALIGRMLKAKVVMPDGVRVSTEEGVPQGGPLSPLLSNVVLDELDVELARRRHRFVRYADDCNIYVRSERAGVRVMASITRFIERRLRLKVNAAKSAVARPHGRHFLGFRLSPRKGASSCEVLLSERSERRLRERVVKLTPRNCGRSLAATIAGINAYLEGWYAFFRLCSVGIQRFVHGVDAHIRRRLRAVVLKHWKTKRTMKRRLVRRGVKPGTASKSVYDGRKSFWALSHCSAVDRGLDVRFFTDRGLLSLETRFLRTWGTIHAPAPRWDGSRSKTGRQRGSQPAVPKSRM